MQFLERPKVKQTLKMLLTMLAKGGLSVSTRTRQVHLDMRVVGRLILHVAILSKALVALFTLQGGLLLVRPGLTHWHQAWLAKARGAWAAAAGT